MKTCVAIIGAGPAGLTAAYQLVKENIDVIVFEADPLYVGGIARTITYKDFCFDIGGHRFFSKSAEVENFWSEILPNDLLVKPRLSRIFYRGQFYSYPLKLLETLNKLGWLEALHCLFSYAKAKLIRKKNPSNFTDWVCNRFGRRLYEIFFKTYTEKVWGMPCESISADWAAQRIQGLSLRSAIGAAIFSKKTTPLTIKTLIKHFRYPRKGPGMLWDACAEKIKQGGGKILLGHRVVSCDYFPDEQHWKISAVDNMKNITTYYAADLISSAPLKELILDYLSPILSEATRAAARKLEYRDFLIVALILKERKKLADHWIYIHDTRVDVGRIQNFKAWSADMVPDSSLCCYGMEYFCFEHNELWSLSDDKLIKKARDELIQIGLAKHDDIIDGCVVRQAKAYPVYSADYKIHLETIFTELALKFPRLHLVGRNGLHKYNNQDHAMMTAMLTVRNIVAGRKLFNVHCVNQDAEYIEVQGNANDCWK